MDERCCKKVGKLTILRKRKKERETGTTDENQRRREPSGIWSRNRVS